MNKRDFLTSTLLLSVASVLKYSSAFAESISDDPFLELMAKYKDDPSLRNSSLLETEGKPLLERSRKAQPRRIPSTQPISRGAVDLIVLCEVTSEEYYNKKLKSPIHPGSGSGVTIGIGYDLGYIEKNWFEKDWDRYLTGDVVKDLKYACGLKGGKAKQIVRNYTQIKIDWASANRQFNEIALPLYVAETLHYLPNLAKVSPDCLGALVSLTYNRGASYQVEKRVKGVDRYDEMRSIFDCVDNEEYDKIPCEIRKMKRLWIHQEKMKGLVTRRELEARLFERGLKSKI